MFFFKDFLDCILRMATATLTKKVNKRKGYRTQFLKVLDQAKRYLREENVLEARLVGFDTNLREKGDNLRRLDEEIQELIDVELIEKEVEDCLDFLDNSHDILAEIAVRLNEIKLKNARETASVTASERSTSSSIACKLPKLELSVFSGNPLEWQDFWNRFDVSIGRNEEMADVDKFNYLLRFLSGKH